MYCTRDAVIPPVSRIARLSMVLSIVNVYLRKAGNDYTTIMKASGHKTMSMFLRYNLVNEEDVAGIKWKDLDTDIQSISGSLQDIGLNPDVVLESLLLERGKSIR